MSVSKLSSANSTSSVFNVVAKTVEAGTSANIANLGLYDSAVVPAAGGGSVYVDATTPTTLRFVDDTGAVSVVGGGGGGGDVVGPASSSPDAIARFNLATGKLLNNSSVLLSDDAVLSGADSYVENSETIATPGSALSYRKISIIDYDSVAEKIPDVSDFMTLGSGFIGQRKTVISKLNEGYVVIQCGGPGTYYYYFVLTPSDNRVDLIFLDGEWQPEGDSSTIRRYDNDSVPTASVVFGSGAYQGNGGTSGDGNVIARLNSAFNGLEISVRRGRGSFARVQTVALPVLLSEGPSGIALNYTGSHITVGDCCLDVGGTNTGAIYLLISNDLITWTAGAGFNPLYGPFANLQFGRDAAFNKDGSRLLVCGDGHLGVGRVLYFDSETPDTNQLQTISFNYTAPGSRVCMSGDGKFFAVSWADSTDDFLDGLMAGVWKLDDAEVWQEFSSFGTFGGGNANSIGLSGDAEFAFCGNGDGAFGAGYVEVWRRSGEKYNLFQSIDFSAYNATGTAEIGLFTGGMSTVELSEDALTLTMVGRSAVNGLWIFKRNNINEQFEVVAENFPLDAVAGKALATDALGETAYITGAAYGLPLLLKNLETSTADSSKMVVRGGDMFVTDNAYISRSLTSKNSFSKPDAVLLTDMDYIAIVSEILGGYFQDLTKTANRTFELPTAVALEAGFEEFYPKIGTRWSLIINNSMDLTYGRTIQPAAGFTTYGAIEVGIGELGVFEIIRTEDTPAYLIIRVA